MWHTSVTSSLKRQMVKQNPVYPNLNSVQVCRDVCVAMLTPDTFLGTVKLFGSEENASMTPDTKAVVAEENKRDSMLIADEVLHEAGYETQSRHHHQGGHGRAGSVRVDVLPETHPGPGHEGEGGGRGGERGSSSSSSISSSRAGSPESHSNRGGRDSVSSSMLASSLTYTRKMAKHNSEISEDLPRHAEDVAAGHSPDSSPSNDVPRKERTSVEHRAGNDRYIRNAGSSIRSAGVGSFIQGHMSREEVLQRMNHPEKFQESDAAMMDFNASKGSLRKGLSREGSMSRRREKPSSTGRGGGWGSPTGGGAKEGGMGGGGGGGGSGDSDGGGEEKEHIAAMVRAQTGVETEVGNGNEKDGDDGGDENDDDDRAGESGGGISGGYGDDDDGDSDSDGYGNFHPPGAYELELEGVDYEEEDEDYLMMAMELEGEEDEGSLEIGI